MINAIGLIGMPGSGKTALAHALQDYYIRGDADCETCYTPVGIVDKYAENTGFAGQYAIGLEGGWMASVSIAVARYNAERSAMATAKTIISCGTAIETAIYLASHFQEKATYITESEGPAFKARMDASMRFMAALYNDTFNYNSVYYLPPYFKEDPDPKWMEFDKNLQASFQSFDMADVTPLMVEGGSLEEVTAKRVEAIFATKEERDVAQVQR